MTAAPSPILRRAESPLDSVLLEDIQSGRLEQLDAEEILIWALGNFHPRMSLS